MSDALLRDLERRISTGDMQAHDALVRELQRKGDQAALCGLGVHDTPGDVQGWPRSPLRWLECVGCTEVVILQWVSRSDGVARYWLTRHGHALPTYPEIEAGQLLFMGADGRVAIRDPGDVSLDSAIGIAVPQPVVAPE